MFWNMVRVIRQVNSPLELQLGFLLCPLTPSLELFLESPHPLDQHSKLGNPYSRPFGTNTPNWAPEDPHIWILRLEFGSELWGWNFLGRDQIIEAKILRLGF
jgi:hypothetical protein